MYGYDSAGRLKSVFKGYSSSTLTAQWVRGCSIKAPQTGDPGMALVSARGYRPGGFISQETNRDVTRVITTDGFGRPIRSDGPTTPVVASRMTGYDTRGRVAWAAEIRPDAVYAKPAMTTPGLVSMTEYDYDLIDRVVAERRWVVDSREILTVTHDYDDVHRTSTTTDRGVRTSTTFDGLGRIVSGNAADGSTMSITHSPGTDVVKTQTNQGTQLVRTIQLDGRGRVTRVLDENNVELASTGYDDDDHVTTESHRGAGTVTRTYATSAGSCASTRTCSTAARSRRSSVGTQRPGQDLHRRR